jgi:hypothetical protein
VHARPSEDTIGLNASLEPLLIDLESGEAKTTNWESRYKSCSDSIYVCILIPDRMALVFPRRCKDALGLDKPSSAIGRFRAVAPAPHLAQPSGSYIVDAFPNILLIYFANEGLVQVREVKRTPYDPKFDPNDTVKRYRIAVKGGSRLFRCA